MRMRGAAQGHSTGRAEGFGGAQNCADVAGVLHAGENDDEWVGSAKKGFECELWRAQQSGNTLRSFRGGDGGEKLVRGTQDESGAVEFREKRGQGFFGGRAGEDGFEFEAGADRFGNEPNGFEADAVVFWARRMEDRAKRFEPVVFARGDGGTLRGARRGGFS